MTELSRRDYIACQMCLVLSTRYNNMQSQPSFDVAIVSESMDEAISMADEMIQKLDKNK